MAKKRKKKSMGRCAGCGTGIARKRQLCSSCTAALRSMGHQPAAVKTAGGSVAPSGQRDYWSREMMRSADPAQRELIRATFLQPADMLAKSAGNVSYLPGAAERDLEAWYYAEPDPGRRQEIWAQLHPQTEGGGAA